MGNSSGNPSGNPCRPETRAGNPCPEASGSGSNAGIGNPVDEPSQKQGGTVYTPGQHNKAGGVHAPRGRIGPPPPERQAPDDDGVMTRPSLPRRLWRHLVLSAAAAVVLLAAYVSAGRQFMPALSGYAGAVERRIQSNIGIPVSIDSIEGDFSGFSPVARIHGLRFLVDGGGSFDDPDAGALVFDSATMVVDVARSILRRRWVLSEFVVENLELDARQTPSGSWELSGVSVAGDAVLDFGALYSAFREFARLELDGVAVNVRTRAGGAYRFDRGAAAIRNQGQEHFLHVDAALEGNPERIAFSLEVRGDALDDMSGRLHVSVPDADYSALFAGQRIGAATIDRLVGRGEMWIDIADGRFSGGVLRTAVDDLAFAIDGGAPMTLTDMQGRAKVARGLGLDRWDIALADMSARRGGRLWRSFNGFLSLAPGRSAALRADRVDLAFVAGLALDSGLLGDEAARQLADYSPEGFVENLSLSARPAPGRSGHISMTANLADVAVGSVKGSPSMWGIDGYLELNVDGPGRSITGFGEIDAEDFSINIPKAFTSVWDYSHVNGRVRFDVDLSDGVRTRLRSGIVMAESGPLDGRSRFSSMVRRRPDGRREAWLDLLVGIERLDASRKSLYLPDGPDVEPRLRRGMEYLEEAVLGGEIRGSGLVFRGSTLPGAAPVNKAVGALFLLEDGEFAFDEAWPRLERMAATVRVRDEDVDVEVAAAESMGIGLQASAAVRRDASGRDILTAAGRARGDTQRGLDYLQAAPVGEDLKAGLASWSAQGTMSADIEVAAPLGRPEREPELRLDIALAGNEVLVADSDLEVSALDGRVVFDTRSGLEDSALAGRMFGGEVDIALSSGPGPDGAVRVAVSGRSTPERMIAWPRQGAFARKLFARMEGDFGYQALLRIDQDPDRDARAPDRLTIASDLVGAALDLPHPFGKAADEAAPLTLVIDMGEPRQRVVGSYGDALEFDLAVEDGRIVDGLALAGTGRDRPAPPAAGQGGGLALVGRLDRFELEEWTAFADAMNDGDAPLSGQIDYAEIETEEFSLYGQTLPEVAFRAEPGEAERAWLVFVGGDAAQGRIDIPYESGRYLKLELDHLRLPGGEEDDPAGPDEGERTDPLADIDPREMPLMQFSTGELTIGGRDFGSWSFTLTPTATGAEFHDLAFNFRGLRLGLDALDDSLEYLEPHFSWHYEGAEHESELTGVLTAGDIGAVLEANGYAPSLRSERAMFATEVRWPGTPALFSGDRMSGRLDLRVENGRFLQNSGGGGALKLVSFINLAAIFQRLRFSDDLLRSGLAYDEVVGSFRLDDGLMAIEDRVAISGPSSLYQITGEVDLEREAIAGEMYVTLPVSDNLPWIGLLTANLPLAVGAYLIDRIFGDQVDSLSSAVYTLDGPFEGLEPEFKQAFGSPPDEAEVR